MSLPSDLLAQARALAGKERKRPKQTSLRRAVSAAYYSLFHLLAEDAAAAMFPGKDAAGLRAVVRRALQHSDMKNAAKSFGSGNPAEPWASLIDAPSSQLRTIADSFVDLQDARHQADYDLGVRFGRAEVLELVDRAERATAAWKQLRKDPESRSFAVEARVFLAALLLNNRVKRS